MSISWHQQQRVNSTNQHATIIVMECTRKRKRNETLFRPPRKVRQYLVHQSVTIGYNSVSDLFLILCSIFQILCIKLHTSILCDTKIPYYTYDIAILTILGIYRNLCFCHNNDTILSQNMAQDTVRYSEIISHRYNDK